MILEDQYKQMLEELAEKKEHLKNVRPATAIMKKDEHRIKLLENNLDQALIRYNDIQTVNKKLRTEIDVMRKEQRNQLRVNKNLINEISERGDKAKKLNGQTYSGQRLSEETNNQILALKANHEVQKITFERNIKSLQDKLKEKDQREEDLEEEKRAQLAGVKASKDATMSKTKTGGIPATQEFSNPVAVLKLRLSKWVAQNKEKKNLMDMYVRNVKIIEDAFDQIKEATGISSVEEIVTTFIKAEEQNYSLYNYVNMLNSEIDTIEEQNRNIEQQIAKHEKLAVMSQNDKAKMRVRLTSEIEELTAASVAKEDQITGMEGQMLHIKDSVQSMVEQYREANATFPLMVAKHMHYEAETQFNEQNVTLYLAELEEYSSMLITYLAYKNEMPDAAVSALSLDQMIEKDREAGPLHVRTHLSMSYFPYRSKPLTAMMSTQQMTQRLRMRSSQTAKISTRGSKTWSLRITSTLETRKNSIRPLKLEAVTLEVSKTDREQLLY